MTTPDPRLESIALTNFRSIRGTINVPLGAPVVLIHGANGTGKTSVLSAIELALSGQIGALGRSEPHYARHLLHHGTTEGSVALRVGSRPSSGFVATSLETKIDSNGAHANPLLRSDLARFFAERCYLAQWTLARLLEIYQFAERGSESPLTKFVKELLGLDVFEAVIEGLAATRDVRNLRKLVPDYVELEEELERVSAAMSVADRKLQTITSRRSVLQAEVRAELIQLPEGRSQENGVLELAAVGIAAGRNREDAELEWLERHERHLNELQQEWSALSDRSELLAIRQAEQAESDARSRLNEWRRSGGARLEAAIEALRSVFPDLPSAAEIDPSIAKEAASVRAMAEVRRCTELLKRDDEAQKLQVELESSVERARARVELIDSQVGASSADAAGLAKALATLLPFIDGEACPVCGRPPGKDESPLTQKVASNVARLSERASQMENLLKARAETIRSLTAQERERDAVAGRRLSQPVRVETQSRLSWLAEAVRSLQELEEVAASGVEVIRRDAVARGKVAAIRERSGRSSRLRQALDELLMSIGAKKEAAQSFEVASKQAGDVLAKRLEEVRIRKRRRQTVAEGHRELIDLVAQASEISGDLGRYRDVYGRLLLQKRAADRCRRQSRQMVDAALQARASVVRQVFNTSLNSVWRDLFVRLAPDEPFVPAFRIPDSADSPVAAKLETVHRNGGRSGAPGAMLSAGNLNTAALTLFLALHLSVSKRLPWLVLDDPVQSMDEVHVAQFAALLRTLSKEHGRQVVIAVHERALFEYLSLELSPAFKEDLLITVELGRSSSGDSTAESSFVSWRPDAAIAG